MDLQKRLAEIQQEFETGDTPQKTVDVLNGHIESLLAADVTKDALNVGDLAPLDLMVQSISGTNSLESFFSEKYLVLTWFRGNW